MKLLSPLTSTALLPGLALVLAAGAEPLSLLNGRYVAPTNVSDRAAITLDIEAIHKATSIESALEIYTNGTNSVKSDGSVRTLMALSTSGQSKMMSEPEYTKFRHALSITKAGVDSSSTPDYANRIILDHINGGDYDLAVEAAVSLTLWMYTIHELRDAYKDCMTGDLNANQGRVKALDEAAAFYIGANQIEADDNGFSLYTLAQNAGDQFGTLSADSGEAKVNEDVLKLMNEAQQKLQASEEESSNGSCLQVRHIVDKIVSQMTVPLVQKLLAHAYSEDTHKMENYGLALIPLIEGCNFDDFAILYDLVVTNHGTFSFDEHFDVLMDILEANYDCLGITCADVGSLNDSVGACNDNDGDAWDDPIAGYVPETDVRHHAALDLDVWQMGLFMDAEAYDVALDLYTYGRNSRKGSGYRTLSDLATTTKREVVPSYSTFVTYFDGDKDYADSIIQNALRRRGQFSDISPSQSLEVVVKTVQYMVVYMYILRELYDALDDCNSGSPNDNYGDVKAIDEAWAFYVGSMEGTEVGGSVYGQGMYALAKKRCDEFNTCTDATGSNSQINEELLSIFQDAQSHMNRMQCDDLRGDIAKIEPYLIAPLVQGSLRYAIINSKYEAGETDGDIGEGFVFSRSTLPLVKKVQPDAAATIESNLDLDLNSKPMADGVDAVFDAYEDALPLMGVECGLVGSVDVYGGVCPSTGGGGGGGDGGGAEGTAGGSSGMTTNTLPEGFVSFLNNRYIATTDVSDRAAISRDVEAIHKAIGPEEALDIYLNGRHSFKSDGTKRTLSALGTPKKKMMSEPEYVRFHHALARTKAGTGDFATADYANKLVLEHINNGEFPLASGSAVALIVWMYTVHELRDAYKDCMTGDQNANQGRVKALDEAVAFYVGHNQTVGHKGGFALYNLAQSAGGDFGTLNSQGEALVNDNIIQLMVQAQEKLSSAETGDNGAGSCLEVRGIVDKIVSQMTVPLVQKLLAHLHQNDQGKMRDYALAIVPLLEGCSPGDYDFLYDMLVTNYTSVEDVDFDEVLDILEFNYDCLGITCGDVGAFLDFYEPCEDDDLAEAIAGYEPSTTVRDHALLDLDVLQIGLFLDSEAYDVARDLYMYGRNSKKGKGYRTLHKLATSAKRTVVPTYDTYREYFGDDDYAHSIIMDAINKRSLFENASPQQVREVVLKTIQYMVMHMYILRELYDAHVDCQNDSPNENVGNVKAVDEAWAFLVGSIEGQEEGGYSTGQGIYALAKKRCEEFNTCEDDGNAKINVDLLGLFRDAQSHLNQLKCDDLMDDISKIEPLLLAPLVQGALRYAIINDQYQAGETDGNIGEGYVFSRSTLPLAKRANAEAAATIETNLDFTLDSKPVSDGTQAVFNAYAVVVPLMGIDCASIGTVPSFGDLCTMITTSSSKVDSVNPVNSSNVESGNPVNDAGRVSFLNGRYVATTDVTDRAQISKDVEAIHNVNSVNEALDIYTNGLNSVKSDGTKRTLAALSTSGETKMMSEPEYVRFNHALTVTKAGSDDFAASDYANKFIMEQINKGSFVFASNAAVALTLWMYTVHELRDTYKDCMDGDLNANEGRVKALDEAVAFYVGHNQTAGAEGGFSLYSLAQSSAADFGTLNSDGEAKVNENILKLMNEAQEKISGDDSDTGSCLQVRHIVDKIVSQMTVPLIQKLITHMHQGDHRNIRMYGLAIVPLLEGCSPDDYDQLYELLITNYRTFDDFEEALDVLEFNYDCLGIKCGDVGAFLDFYLPCEDDDGSEPIAGYEPSTDVRHHNLLDLDILQISLFLDSEAYDVARDLYTYGRNSRKGSSYRTLYGLATTTKRVVVPTFKAFVGYFQDGNYANSIIMAAMAKQGIFADASREQIKEIVHKTIQYMVMHMYILREMYDAYTDCRSGDPTNNVGDVKAVDEAWAFLVGSIEGQEVGGYPDGQGIYALAKKRCEQFGTCDSDGNAKINDDLLAAFTDAQSHMNQLDCDALKKDIAKIEPFLLVPLIQGALRYAIINDQYQAGATNGDIGEGYVFSRSTLPLVKQANPGAAATIESNLDFTLDSKPVPDGTQAVFQAYADALPAMGIYCDLIGSVEDYGSMCALNDSSSVSGSMSTNNDSSTSSNGSINPDDPTVLAGGLFVTSTNVEDRAMMAADHASMLEALVAGDSDSARDIYENGKNSKKFDTDGTLNGKIRTFKGFSTAALEKMKQEPTFNIFTYALRDRKNAFENRPVHEYAETYVQGTFDKGTLAAEAVVALHLWMYTLHELEDAMQDCRKAETVRDPQTALRNNIGGVLALDEAAAFYVGTDQEAGDPNGHLLYALAEKAAALFGTEDNGQAAVNTNVLQLLNDAKVELTYPDACTADSTTYSRLRFITDAIISQMTVPLIQSLIQNMVDDDKDRVKLYGIAVAPLVAACDPSKFTYLKASVIDSQYRAEKFDDIMRVLQSTYSCLRISCDDVGTYKQGEDNNYPVCSEPDALTPIAGYVPTTDVREHAKIDLDILQIKILMSMNATEAAMDLYMLGRNSRKGDSMRSVHNLATNENREIVPQFDLFRKYFSHHNYADQVVMDVLNDKRISRFYGASPEQKTEAVVKTLQYQVMYMYVLREMYDSADDCDSGDPLRNAGSAKAWDEVAAFFIGSIEGPSAGGDSKGNGQLMYALNKKRCSQFGTCSDSADALVNDQIMTLLIAGKDDVERSDCPALRSKIAAIEPLLSVGMIQGTLRYAILNAELPPGSTDGNLAEGDIFFSSVAPLVKKSSPGADHLISTNMAFQLKSQPVADGSDIVFQSFTEAIPGMGLHCNDVGVVDGRNVCPEGDQADARSGVDSAAVAGVVLSRAVLLIGVAAFLIVP